MWLCFYIWSDDDDEKRETALSALSTYISQLVNDVLLSYSKGKEKRRPKKMYLPIPRLHLFEIDDQPW
jgi:hypothetical protein